MIAVEHMLLEPVGLHSIQAQLFGRKLRKGRFPRPGGAFKDQESFYHGRPPFRSVDRSVEMNALEFPTWGRSELGPPSRQGRSAEFSKKPSTKALDWTTGACMEANPEAASKTSTMPCRAAKPDTASTCGRSAYERPHRKPRSADGGRDERQ